MPAARAASAREAPSGTSARASIRRAARASRHRPASRRSSAAPGSRRVTATVMAPSADRLHRRSTPAGRAGRHGPNGHKPRPLVLRRELGLPPGPNPFARGLFSPTLSLAMFSPLLGRPQPDWPASARITGFAFHDREDPGRESPPALAAFLDAGPAPIIATLGSGAAKTAAAGPVLAATLAA